MLVHQLARKERLLRNIISACFSEHFLQNTYAYTLTSDLAAQKLVDTLKNLIELDPSVYDTFISILESHQPKTVVILEQLEKCFQEVEMSG